ncbi:MAG: ElaA protein [Chitinophagales bacterium]|jgi:ElaA protein
MEYTFLVKDFEALTTRELYDIMHLRQEVFIIEQDCAYQDADFKDLKGKHIFSYNGDKLTSYARLLYPGISYTEASIGRVVTSPAVRRKGLGRPLMAKCIEVLEKDLKTAVCRISAQSYLIPYYSEFGFEICSEEYLEDGLPHFEMLRT